MADDNLKITVETDVSQATVSFSDLMAALTQVSTGAKTAADGLTTTEKAASSASAGAKELESVGQKLDDVLEQVGEHSRTVAIGFETLGLGGAEAAARVGGLVEALQSLSGAVPELLLVVAAFTAISASIDFFKDAISDASEMQNSMQLLGSAVQSQGGNWDENKESVEAWVQQEALASGILESELIPALDKLVSSGHDLADSEKILAVAEELARAKNISVAEATIF